MIDKSVREEIYYGYTETERGQADLKEFGFNEALEAANRAYKELFPGCTGDVEDVMDSCLFDFIRVGFYCGMRETARHLLGIAEELDKRAGQTA